MTTSRPGFAAITRVPFADEPHWVLCPKRIRVVFGGGVIADSSEVRLYRAGGLPPVCFFPAASVALECLTPSGAVNSALGAYTLYSLAANGSETADAAWSFTQPNTDVAFLAGMFAFKWQDMEAWFEEDDEIFSHIRDPFKRIDTVRSTAHVTVETGGETLAESNRTTLLLEPALPVRYYFPAEDVRMDLLDTTATTSECPYKGRASYYSAMVGGKSYDDVAWTYDEPLREAAEVAGMICFFNERVDSISVDGEQAIKPLTPWSPSSDQFPSDLPMTPWGPPSPSG